MFLPTSNFYFRCHSEHENSDHHHILGARHESTANDGTTTYAVDLVPGSNTTVLDFMVRKAARITAFAALQCCCFATCV